MGERRAVFIDKRELSFFEHQGDCNLKIPDHGHAFIRNVTESSLQTGQILMLEHGDVRVPDTDDEVYYYWEIVRDEC